MGRCLIWPTQEISSILKSSVPRKTPPNRTLLFTNWLKQQGSVTSLNQDPSVRPRMTSRLSISIIFPSSLAEKTTNSWCNHSKRKKLSERSSQTSKGLRMEKFTSIASFQTSWTRAYTTNHVDFIDTRKMPRGPCTSKLSRMMWSKKWMRLSGQSTWPRLYTVCGSTPGQQLSKCTSPTLRSLFSSQESSFNTSHKNYNQCVKLRLSTGVCLKRVGLASNMSRSKSSTKKWSYSNTLIQIK